MDSVEILDLARKICGLKSDRKLAKALGIHESRISLIRNRHRKLDGATCLKLAELMGLEPAYLMALVAAERAKDARVQREWRKAAALLKRGAAAVALAAVLAVSQNPTSAEAGQSVLRHDDVYIMRSRRYRRRRRRPARNLHRKRRVTDRHPDFA